MSTATAPANGSVVSADMKRIVEDQRAAKAAGRNLYQTFQASIAGGVAKAKGWFGRFASWSGLDRLLGKAWSFASPWMARGRAVASRVGVLPSLAFGLTTHRGRHFLLVTLPTQAYRIASWPFRLVGRGIARLADQLGFSNVTDTVTAQYDSLVSRVQKYWYAGLDWLNDNHSSWGMRYARNGLFALLSLRVISFIPVFPLQVVAFAVMLLVPTSEIRDDKPGGAYADSIGWVLFDTVMALLGRATNATEAADVTAGATRSPKPSDLARQAGERAEREARENGANRAEAREIGRMTRRQHMEAASVSREPVIPLVPTTA